MVVYRFISSYNSLILFYIILYHVTYIIFYIISFFQKGYGKKPPFERPKWPSGSSTSLLAPQSDGGADGHPQVIPKL